MLVKNPNLGDWSFVWKAFTREEFWYSDAGFLPHFRNYRPLLLVLYWIDYRLFGLNPAPWHASAVLVHLVAVWLVFKISRRLSNNSTSALLAASLFALTPVHVAAVGWMAGSGFALAAAFGLAAFYLILPRADGSVRTSPGAIALYACALLSHESATSFPALVACYAFIFIEGRDTTLWNRVRRAVIWSAPFAIELLLYLCIRRMVLGFFVSNPYDFANLLTNAQAVLTVPLVFATYLAILAIPTLTMPNHTVLPVSSLLSPEFWEPLARDNTDTRSISCPCAPQPEASALPLLRGVDRNHARASAAAALGVSHGPGLLSLSSIGWIELAVGRFAGCALTEEYGCQALRGR